VLRKKACEARIPYPEKSSKTEGEIKTSSNKN
jgi:hypothetical protein